MKKFLTVICLLSITSTVLAVDLDGSIFEENATKAAYTHASDNVFGEILDSDSSVIARLDSQDASQYTFVASHRNLSEVCTVKVIVSKETGMAFNDDDMICGTVEATAK